MADATNAARGILAAGALFGMLGVAAGAFGAHGLKNSLDAYGLGIFETAARYQMYHALALLGTGVLAAREDFSSRWLGASALLFGAGILLFSGSLYGLALGAPRWTGMITPIGGLLFMAGWLTLAIAVLGGRSQSGE